MARSASVIRRHLRLSALPLALVSLTACGTLDAAPTGLDLAKQEGKGRGKPVNVLKDGGFEPGAVAWTADPASLLCTVSCPVGEPHKGSGWAQFGASEGATETLSQTVTIPKGRARLEFRLHDGALGGDARLEALVDGQVMFSYDAADVPVVDDEDEDEDEDEGVPTRLASRGFYDDDDEDEDENFTEDYEKVKFDVSAFADGGPHTVSFRVAVGEGVAGLSVDDAALTVKLLKNLVPEMAQDVSALKLPKAVSKPLTTKLDKAAAALARRDAKAAIKELKAFAKEVRGHRGKKIKAPAADDLIEEAQEVIEVID